MSNIIILNNMTIKVKGEQLLHIKKATVEKGSIIGLIGPNGSGKSTLLNYIVGKLFPEEITVAGEFLSKVTKVGYYQQEVETYNAVESVIDYALLSEYNLGDWKKDQKFDQMSGGEKGKKRLLDVFSNKLELLVLDEPTNHLDREGIEALKTLVATHKGSLIMVSHDRSFIEETCNTIWEIRDQELISFNGSLSQFEAERERKLREQEKAYDKHVKEQKQLEKELQALKNWSASAHAQSTKQEFPKEYYRSKAKRMDSQRKSAEKRLGKKLKESQNLEFKKEQAIRFDMDTGTYKTGKAFLLDEVSKQYGQKRVLDKLSLTINFGDKLLIEGSNGSGKTTLLKILVGEVAADGGLWTSQFARIGYLKQEIVDLPVDQTVEEYVGVSNETRERFALLSHQLGLSLTQLQQKIETLSMGERLKVKLLYFMMREMNVLILDEPTNHLDYPSRQALEKVLVSYPGTLIFTSHDERFSQTIATRTIQVGRRLNESKNETETSANKSKLVLEMEKDRLMSELSFLSPGSDEYGIKNERFLEVIQALKAYN